MVRNEDVLRLEVPMVDPAAMAVAYRVQELEEDMLGPHVIANILATLGDVIKEVTLWAVLQDNKEAILVFNNPVHAHHVGVGRRVPMQMNFPGLKHDLAMVQGASVGIEFTQHLDSIAGLVVDVDGRVDDTICACPQNADKSESLSDNCAQSGLGRDRRSADDWWRCRRGAPWRRGWRRERQLRGQVAVVLWPRNDQIQIRRVPRQREQVLSEACACIGGGMTHIMRDW